jgi:hypothetical protein
LRCCGDFSEEVISDLLSAVVAVWSERRPSGFNILVFLRNRNTAETLIVTNENYAQYRRVDRSGGGMPVRGNIIPVRADVLDGGNQARNFRLQSRDESGNR